MNAAIHNVEAPFPQAFASRPPKKARSLFPGAPGYSRNRVPSVGRDRRLERWFAFSLFDTFDSIAISAKDLIRTTVCMSKNITIVGFRGRETFPLLSSATIYMVNMQCACISIVATLSTFSSQCVKQLFAKLLASLSIALTIIYTMACNVFFTMEVDLTLFLMCLCVLTHLLTNFLAVLFAVYCVVEPLLFFVFVWHMSFSFTRDFRHYTICCDLRPYALGVHAPSAEALRWSFPCFLANTVVFLPQVLHLGTHTLFS
jgi:hypothetical protein